MSTYLKNVLLAVLLLSGVSLYSQITLPRLISDHMILQREADVRIWGWAAPGENVSITFMDNTHQTVANSRGEWYIMLKNLTAGGPYTMKLEASNTITINDILIGDVWVGSGQSNMEMPMRRVSWKYPEEIKNANYDAIRQFVVPRRYEFNQAQTNLTGGNWVKASPASISEFSATAYFFAKELHYRYKVPIGIINSAWGGSPVEAWISEEALKQFPAYFEDLQKNKDNQLVESIKRQDQDRISQWHSTLRQKDRGFDNQRRPWYSPKISNRGWKSFTVPGNWNQAGETPENGVFWFRKKVDLPAGSENKSALLILGCIVDSDSVFVNGKFVGTTGFQFPPRRYQIPAGVLQGGRNTIVVRVISEQGFGGFVEDKDYKLVFDNQTIDLSGEWKYRQGAAMPPLQGRKFFNTIPGGLFNAMIYPLKNYAIKGVIWYQGESNAGRPHDYNALFSTMIPDWRNHWGKGDIPFIFVQLPNFHRPATDPNAPSNWALLREQQLKTLAVRNTAMAVAIDIGEWNDIHPLNKKDVGIRLSKAARRIAYGDCALVHSGPIYEACRIDGNRIIISFSNIGSGLTTNDSKPLRHFAIAGEDGKFVWANAEIVGEEVVVWHESITSPVAVRYAWSDNPEGANLFNKEGLPASPFRTTM